MLKKSTYGTELLEPIHNGMTSYHVTANYPSHKDDITSRVAEPVLCWCVHLFGPGNFFIRKSPLKVRLKSLLSLIT